MSDHAGDMLAFPEPLVAIWQMIVLPADAYTAPPDVPEDAAWRQASVPGTALADAGPSSGETTLALHDRDVWYRTCFVGRSGESLRFLGLAGLAEIWIDEACVARSTNMFTTQTVLLSRSGEIRLAIRFRSLTAALQLPAGRSRWRSRLVTSNGLRQQRQTLLGHMPGWSPSFHAVGPYRQIERIAATCTVRSFSLSTTMRGTAGLLSVRMAIDERPGQARDLVIRVRNEVVPLREEGGGQFTAELVLPDIERWWPHTHGHPALHEVFLRQGRSERLLGRVGFRDVVILRGDDGNGFGFEINGVPVFCRGACWTNADLLGLGSRRETYASWLELVRDAGMNMIRVGGTMLYESKDFHDLCDEMGILVWQDLMFANLDYATDQPAFRESVILEVEQLVERTAASPSMVVLCGGSEMAQQATFLGLDVNRRAMEFFETFLPALVTRLKPDLHYVPHSPWGGPVPVAVSSGIAHYYGVGAYRRPLDDARRAGVRFATECLAFANPPMVNSPSSASIGIGPRDRGSSWDFADTRDHYLRELYRVDPASLRSEDPGRYFDLSRAVTADLMEAVFAEWRRPGSTCAGGLVWQLQDLAPGSGWGIIDNHAWPKAAWHGLRRVLAPIQILLSDEGLDGLGVHVLNETAEPLQAIVRLACLKRGSTVVATAECDVTVPPRGALSLSSLSMFGSFFDINRAYRFGPSEHEINIATLSCASSGRILSDAFHFPLGRVLAPDDLGLSAVLSRHEGNWCVDIAARRFAQAVHLEVDGYRALDDWFHLSPGVDRRVALTADRGVTRSPTGIVNALNSMTPVAIKQCP